MKTHDPSDIGRNGNDCKIAAMLINQCQPTGELELNRVAISAIRRSMRWSGRIARL